MAVLEFVEGLCERRPDLSVGGAGDERDARGTASNLFFFSGGGGDKMR